MCAICIQSKIVNQLQCASVIKSLTPNPLCLMMFLNKSTQQNLDHRVWNNI